MQTSMGSMTNGSMTTMMVPWLHFTGGDSLFFQSWHPSSSGAIAGACIGLALLSIFDRWIAARRNALDYYWRKRLRPPSLSSDLPEPKLSNRALVLASQSGDVLPSCNSTPEKLESLDVKSEVRAESRQLASNYPTNTKRTIPRFILRHDVPRGLFHAGQSLLVYILMLAVMTFNAAYIISIVLGLGIGEMIFDGTGSG